MLKYITKLEMSHPANTLPPHFDEMQPRNYDPEYTANISMNMHIPDRIAMSNNYTTDYNNDRNTFGLHHMDVPDKLIVLGTNESIGVREDPQLHLDLVALPSEDMFVNLSTPPRVLTLEDRPFPTVADDQEHNTLHNGYIKPYRDVEDDESLPSGIYLAHNGPQNEFDIIKNHIVKLSRHVKSLEEQNVMRSRRDTILYSLLLAYGILKLSRWFLASK